MAHKRGGGTARTNRDSISKRRGVKRFGGELVKSGNILIRQTGNQFFPGRGTEQGRDFTIFATLEGKVVMKKDAGKKFVEVI